jgi:hypothetical protein
MISCKLGEMGASLASFSIEVLHADRTLKLAITIKVFCKKMRIHNMVPYFGMVMGTEASL